MPSKTEIEAAAQAIGECEYEDGLPLAYEASEGDIKGYAKAALEAAEKVRAVDAGLQLRWDEQIDSMVRTHKTKIKDQAKELTKQAEREAELESAIEVLGELRDTYEESEAVKDKRIERYEIALLSIIMSGNKDNIKNIAKQALEQGER